MYLYIINRMSKQDKSPKVTQRGKLTAGLQIKDLKWTKKQQDFIKLALDKETRLIFVSGPAGSSKTLLSIYCSLCLIRDKKVSDIIYVRSPVESSDSKIGGHDQRILRANCRWHRGSHLRCVVHCSA